MSKESHIKQSDFSSSHQSRQFAYSDFQEKPSKTKSIKFVFILVIVLFILVLIISLILSFFVIMQNVYSKINDNYLNNFILAPMQEIQENFTAILEIRMKTLDNILVESSLANTQILMDFMIKNPSQGNQLVAADQIAYSNKTINNTYFIDDEFFMTLYYRNSNGSLNDNELSRDFFNSDLKEVLRFLDLNSDMPILSEEFILMDIQTENYCIRSRLDHSKQRLSKIALT